MSSEVMSLSRERIQRGLSFFVQAKATGEELKNTLEFNSIQESLKAYALDMDLGVFGEEHMWKYTAYAGKHCMWVFADKPANCMNMAKWEAMLRETDELIVIIKVGAEPLRYFTCIEGWAEDEKPPQQNVV